jgi:adenylate cyclase
MLHSKFKSQVAKIVWITLFWIVISVFQFLASYSTLIQFNYDLTGLKTIMILKGSIITGFIAGLLGGSFIVFLWGKWLRTKSYGWSLLNIFWSYSLVYLVIAVISGLLFHAIQLDVPIFHLRARQATWTHLASLITVYNYLFWLLVVVITFIALLVNDKYGPGVFRSFLLGKYFHPKREDRIFMFLDLRGSTTIAERLGEYQYFHFLKSIFRDATPGIINSKGEIYQYVGDEIVISWKKDSGIQNANCLQCFFDIQQCFLDKASYYRETFDGIVPEFKAGLHYGFVMTGEIGVIKRDIAHSGDVLNTTARIQSKCNELGVNILISNHLLEKLELLSTPFKPIIVGEMALRGKQQTVMLYSL